MNTTSQIKTITLSTNTPASPLQREREEAIGNLIRKSQFQPVNDQNAPYDLTLSVVENKLVVEIKNADGTSLNTLVMSLSPYRRLIADYFMMIESYEHARHGGTSPCKLEAIDMGRRSLHNEGAEILTERLKDKITIDFETARRLFTLICSLQSSSTMILR